VAVPHFGELGIESAGEYVLFAFLHAAHTADTHYVAAVYYLIGIELSIPVYIVYTGFPLHAFPAAQATLDFHGI
jgi:hypothetical protein